MKYMGSKARIAKEISPILNKAIIDNKAVGYIEPFVGGANMMENIEALSLYGLDSNEYLIAMWKALQTGWCPPENITKSEYESIRDNKNAYPKELVAFAGLVATYNAKWFGGYAGIVHTKIGTERNYYDEARRNVLKQLPKLERVKFATRKFQDIDCSKLQNYVIYCDPPYANSTQYKDSFNHLEFWEWVRSLSENNTVFVSEYTAPVDFESVWEKTLTTSLDKNSRKQDTERLFVYKRTIL